MPWTFLAASSGRAAVAAVLVLLCGASIIWFMGSRNPFTPAGYVGYLTKGAVLGHSRFYGIQKGPTSPGRTWLLDVTNISVTPYTYTENFTGEEAVLSRDNLKIAFRVHTVWRVDETQSPALHGALQHDGRAAAQEKEPDSIVQSAYGNFVARAAEDVTPETKCNGATGSK